MSTPASTWCSACSLAPASAATATPFWCARSMTSAGGEPRALAISLICPYLRVCSMATSTCERATECSQPRTPVLTRSPPPGNGGTPRSSRVRSTKARCSGGIMVSRSTFEPSVGIFAGITTSTPKGLPSVFSCIHSRTASSSSVSLNRTQPSTPSPPARLIAAATSSLGVNPKIGDSIPNFSHSAVFMDVLVVEGGRNLRGCRRRSAAR